jgi:hypothetical protein
MTSGKTLVGGFFLLVTHATSTTTKTITLSILDKRGGDPIHMRN